MGSRQKEQEPHDISVFVTLVWGRLVFGSCMIASLPHKMWSRKINRRIHHCIESTSFLIFGSCTVLAWSDQSTPASGVLNPSFYRQPMWRMHFVGDCPASDRICCGRSDFPPAEMGTVTRTFISGYREVICCESPSSYVDDPHSTGPER